MQCNGRGMTSISHRRGSKRRDLREVQTSAESIWRARFSYNEQTVGLKNRLSAQHMMSCLMHIPSIHHLPEADAIKRAERDVKFHPMSSPINQASMQFEQESNLSSEYYSIGAMYRPSIGPTPGCSSWGFERFVEVVIIWFEVNGGCQELRVDG